MDRDTQRRFLVNLRQVLLSNENLTIFMNSFGLGNLSSNGAYTQFSKIRFRKTPDSDDISYSSSMTSIRICDFTPRDVSKRSIYIGGPRDDIARQFYNNLYGRYWNEQYRSNRIGINVCKQIKIKGYMLNFNDMRTIMSESISGNSYEKLTDFVNEIYYVGEKNCLIGVSSISGLLYIRQQTLIKLLKGNDDETIQRCLKNLLTCFYHTFKKFSEFNVKTFKDDVAEIIEDGVINQIINDSSRAGRHYYRHMSENESREELLNVVKSYIKDSLHDALSQSVFGIKDSYSYANILSSVLSSRKDMDKKIFGDGFAKGMQLGMKFEMIGWLPVTVEFPDDEATTNMWWQKEVNIVPDTFTYQGERYSIPVDKRSYKITKLYVNQNGKMRCTGNHPNVSGSNVCMGDLVINFNDPLSDIQEVLKRAEELLDMINYDSAYDRREMENLLRVSTKIASLTSKDVDAEGKKIKLPKIREVSFSDSGDEEEVVETENRLGGRVVPIMHNGEVIADTIMEPVVRETTNATHRRNSILGEEDAEQSNTEQITTPTRTYVIPNDNTIVDDIRYVAEDGTRHPVAFFVGTGTAVVQAPPPVNTPDTHELSLGDENLLR